MNTQQPAPSQESAWAVYRNGQNVGVASASTKDEAIAIGKARRGDNPGDVWDARELPAK